MTDTAALPHGTALLTPDDLRAAVAAGTITEAQAARLTVLAQARAGQRAAMGPDDEPFELFRGFAEIFVSVGLILLIAGVMTLAAIMEGPVLPAIAAAVAWVLALYFTRRRRMTLPSIVLAVAFACGALGTIGQLMGKMLDNMQEARVWVLLYAVLGLIALAAHFRTFRVPFMALPMGLVAAGIVFLLVDWVMPFGDFPDSWEAAFDLTHGTGLPVATLIFGLLALAAGLYYDMRDPWRLGRWSATGFWLHILAAPALVNTVALTAWNTGGTAGYLALALALVAITGLALAIDRRSFLTAGLGYLAVLLVWALRIGESTGSIALLLLILGAIVTGLGSWWTDLRGALMRALPAFPGKERLPPYAEQP